MRSGRFIFITLFLITNVFYNYIVFSQSNNETTIISDEYVDLYTITKIWDDSIYYGIPHTSIYYSYNKPTHPQFQAATVLYPEYIPEVGLDNTAFITRSYCVFSISEFLSNTNITNAKITSAKLVFTGTDYSSGYLEESNFQVYALVSSAILDLKNNCCAQSVFETQPISPGWYFSDPNSNYVIDVTYYVNTMINSGEEYCGFDIEIDGDNFPPAGSYGIAYGKPYMRIYYSSPISVIANVGGPYFAKVGEEITFDGSGSTPADSISEYYWDFSDGTTGSGVSTKHSYSSDGIYTVKLKVRVGSSWSDWDEVDVEVSSSKNTVIFIPGFLATRIFEIPNDPLLSHDEIWIDKIDAISDLEDNFLDALLPIIWNDKNNDSKWNFNEEAIWYDNDGNGEFNRSEDTLFHSNIDIEPLFFKDSIQYNYYDELIDSLELDGYIVNICPYDWRRNLENIPINNLKARIEISYSITGKPIDLIAHSTGGLIVKSCLNNYPNLIDKIDKIIFIAVPHYGSTGALEALLLGTNLANWSIFDINPIKLRQISTQFPGVYQLLPSQSYFSYVNEDNPIIRIYDLLSVEFDEYELSDMIITHDDFKEFITCKNDYMYDNHFNYAVNENFYQRAEDFHMAIDSWEPAESGPTCYSIIGYGLGTIKTLDFYDLAPFSTNPGNTPLYYLKDIIRWDGDGTVFCKSAEANFNENSLYYIDLSNSDDPNKSHSTICNNNDVVLQVKNLLGGKTTTVGNIETYSEKYIALINQSKQYFAVHCPVELHIYDSNGNHNGPTTNGIEISIPGSEYYTVGEIKECYLPDNDTYTVEVIGKKSGTFDLFLRKCSGYNKIEEIVYNNIPVKQNSKAMLTVENIDSSVVMRMDEDANGDYEEKILLEPGAIYSQEDFDNDGLSNANELTYGTSLINPDTDNDGLLDGYEVSSLLSDPLLPDSDFDGCDDYHENVTGTNPLDESSKFQVTVISELSYFYGIPMILLGWDSVKGKNYTIYVKSESIGPDFVILKDNITAIGNKSYYFDNGGGPNNVPHPSDETGSRFYKVTVE